jgi:hypothetical protein
MPLLHNSVKILGNMLIVALIMQKKVYNIDTSDQFHKTFLGINNAAIGILP